MKCDTQYFHDLIYPYYPAYTMGCYHFVITGDNGNCIADSPNGLQLKLYHMKHQNTTAYFHAHLRKSSIFLSKLP